MAILRARFFTAFATASFVFGTLCIAAQAGGDHKHMTDAGTTEGIVVSSAVSPATAPGIKASAVYLMLENTGQTDVALVGVESPAFAMGHIHKTAMVDGLMTMEPVAHLSLPAGKMVMFEPGGLHLMLMGAKEALKPGDTIPVTLVFASGKTLKISAVVTEPGEVPSHDHSSMKMN